ncbi:MAG: PAS domain S-box protein [Flavobacteriales bacterium]|nr:PAS domain S-box protein [Flavobacteriales bacterium]
MSKETVVLRAEEQIRLLTRENELLNSIIQGASDSIYAKDLDGRYITINEAGAAFFGLQVDDVIGKTDRDLLGEEGWKYMERDENLYRTGKSIIYESQSVDGKKTQTFSTHKSGLFDSAGKIIGLIGVSRDVTDARLAEKKYQFIFDNAPIGFWEEDFSEVRNYIEELKAQGIDNFRRHFKRSPESLNKCIGLIKILNVNRTTVEMNAADDKASITSRLKHNFTKDSEKVFLEEFVALAEGKTKYQSEATIIDLKGNSHNLLFNLNVLPGHEDSWSLVLVSVVDVSDMRKMENELSSMKYRYQSIVEAQKEMICRVNPEGRILFSNLAFTNFFAFKTKSDNIKFVTLFPPEELDKCERELRTLSAAEPSKTLELRNYNHEGDLVWQEWSVTAFFGNSGTLLGYQAVGSDVTARKMAQEALASSEARWRTVFDHADDLIMTINSEGYILTVNDYSELPKDVKWAGRTFEDVMLPENAQASMELINHVFTTGKGLKTEFKLLKPGEPSMNTYAVSLSPIFHGKRVITVICIARNVTETKEFEKHNREALIEGQENERTRVSQELHDGLGQLFTAIKLNLQHLKSGLDELEDSSPLFERVQALEDNIGIAISEVKNISRNLMPDVLHQFGLKPAIEDMVDKWNASIENKIRLELVDVNQRFSPELEKALFRMCQELINNSVRHGNASQIYVQLINHEDSIVLMVEDDGSGFKPKTTSKGFGLRNIRSRAEVFDGRVEIDSAPGKGTVTTVEIPLNNSLRQ